MNYFLGKNKETGEAVIIEATTLDSACIIAERNNLFVLHEVSKEWSTDGVLEIY